MHKDLEDFLFGSDGQHGLNRVTIENNLFQISISPFANVNKIKIFSFYSAKMASIETIPLDEDDFSFPLDIIGVDCSILGKDRYSFNLHCACFDFNLTSAWPVLK